ncbi:transposase [Paraburkholderia eburnea]|uniref:Transposase n=1 Tax=Paraburkholderia eburnea TaxID=1189126 RepID=A0A2S4MJX4_9BURK|nr:transposase [Paraburkholderia eburnea]PRZ24316.1 transposase [Paraburkholderia eburnea]
MDLRATDLPDDINALKAMVFARDEIVRKRDAQVADLQEQLSSRAVGIEHLKLTIAKLRRMQFGRQSEKLDRQIEQLELRLDGLQADEGATDMATPAVACRPRRAGSGRKPLPDHLEREVRVHLPAHDHCPDGGGRLKPLGEDVAEQLESVRAHFRVIRHRRPKLASTCCDCIVQAAAPTRPVDRRIPGPALLAHIAVSKFGFHIPLHRQAVMYARDGVEIDPGTMGYWMGSVSQLLKPLVDAVRRYALAGSKIHGQRHSRRAFSLLWFCWRFLFS